MKLIVEASFPLEPFSSNVPKGTAGERVGESFAVIRPEVAYFTDKGSAAGSPDRRPARHESSSSRHRAAHARLRRLRSLPNRESRPASARAVHGPAPRDLRPERALKVATDHGLAGPVAERQKPGASQTSELGEWPILGY